MSVRSNCANKPMSAGEAREGPAHDTSKRISYHARIATVKSGLELSPTPSGIARPGSHVLRPCPLCDSTERKPVFERDAWQIVECAHCKMVFIGTELNYAAQVESHDWLDDYPREMLRRKERHPLLLFLSRRTRWLRPETNGRLLRQTRHWKREGKLADFGCGDARFLARASGTFDVIGIEISPKLAELSRSRMPAAKILEGPVTEVANSVLPEKSFDMVTQFGYIEHEWRPLDGLRAAFRVLKPGGVTLIKTPNYACWNRKVMGADWCGYHIPAHCNYFTPGRLAEMLRRAGFEPLPRRILDRLPTSDSLWMAARRPA